MAQICNFRGNQPEAVKWIDQAIQRNPRNVSLRISRSQFCHDAGRVTEALETLDGIEPGSPLEHKVRWRRMQSLERLGRIDEALGLAAECPTSPPLEAFLARLESRSGDAKAARSRLEQLIARTGVAPRIRGEALMQLSRVCDTLGDYDAAFQAAAAANREFRGDFDAEAYEASTQELIDYFTPERFASLPRSESDSELPVFIIGLPRSGTSLLEQIISAHPSAVGSGERRDPVLIAEDLEFVIGDSFPSCLDGVTGATLTVAGGQYLHMLASYGFGVTRVTNKALGLERIAGLLPLLTPGCRVIFVSRDPLDNLLSIFLHPLRRDRNPWAQSLEDLRVVKEAFDRLRAHWMQVLPCPCHEVSYEQLVSDQRNVTEDLLSFLELPWDDACLAFHESDRAVMTPSYDQVNTAMNAKAIGRWRNYASHLDPLTQAFPPATPA